MQPAEETTVVTWNLLSDLDRWHLVCRYRLPEANGMGVATGRCHRIDREENSRRIISIRLRSVGTAEALGSPIAVRLDEVGDLRIDGVVGLEPVPGGRDDWIAQLLVRREDHPVVETADDLT